MLALYALNSSDWKSLGIDSENNRTSTRDEGTYFLLLLEGAKRVPFAHKLHIEPPAG